MSNHIFERMAEERKISQEELPHMPSTNAAWRVRDDFRDVFLQVQEDEIMPVGRPELQIRAK